MKARSLRLRLMVGGVVAILIALSVAGAGLVFLFERHVIRTIGDDLNIYLNQLIAGIDVDAQARLVLTRPPADPRFSEPLSGLYWQIGDDRGQMLRSRSLWDTVLTLAPDNPAPGEIHQHIMAGPLGTRVLVAERVVSLTLSGQRVPVRVVVAADLGRVSNAAAGFSRDLSIALGLLGLTLAVATIIQVGLGLQPLAALRRGVADIRAGRVRNLAHATSKAWRRKQFRQLSGSEGEARDKIGAFAGISGRSLSKIRGIMEAGRNSTIWSRALRIASISEGRKSFRNAFSANSPLMIWSISTTVTGTFLQPRALQASNLRFVTSCADFVWAIKVYPVRPYNHASEPIVTTASNPNFRYLSQVKVCKYEL
jgi:hypothetical protein